MDGITTYENKIENKIQSILNNGPKILTGYYAYVCTKESLNTAHNYLMCINRFLNTDGVCIENISIDDFLVFMSTHRNKTASYQRNVYFALKSFSNYLYISNRIKKDYMKEVTAPKNVESIKTVQKRKIGYLDTDEIDIFLSSVREGAGNDIAQSRQKKWRERDIAIMYILLTTGMRNSAMYKLDVDNIDWENNTLITVEKGRKVKTYLVPDKTINAIKNWMVKREELLNGKEEKALFISQKRNRLSTDSIADLVNKYSVNIEGKHITPHKLRATYGTQLYKETRDIKFVQDRMGHASPQTTELYIRDDQTEDRKRAAAIMAQFL